MVVNAFGKTLFFQRQNRFLTDAVLYFYIPFYLHRLDIILIKHSDYINWLCFFFFFQIYR